MIKAPSRLVICVFLFLTGCSGFLRQCSSWGASAFGSDWLIIQYNMNGGALKCWRLKDVSVQNEHNSDGIYWQASDGHLVHISGWYNRVQVSSGDWTGAAKALSVNLKSCE